MKYSYLLVEGPHDIEFVARLLKPFGLKRIIKKSNLDSYWDPLIPKSFPPDDDLVKRVPVPIFFQNSVISVAIHSAGGVAKLSNTLEESLVLLPPSPALSAIGIILDADENNETPNQRFTQLKEKLTLIGVTLPDFPGHVSENDLRCGVFIIPDNNRFGSLEDILLDCASVNYADLLFQAGNYLKKIDTAQLTDNDISEFSKPFGEKKAAISAIASILKPGRAIQVSIQDNRWLDGKSLQLPNVLLIQRFLVALLGLSS